MRVAIPSVGAERHESRRERASMRAMTLCRLQDIAPGGGWETPRPPGPCAKVKGCPEACQPALSGAVWKRREAWHQRRQAHADGGGAAHFVHESEAVVHRPPATPPELHFFLIIYFSHKKKKRICELISKLYVPAGGTSVVQINGTEYDLRYCTGRPGSVNPDCGRPGSVNPESAEF